MATDSGDGHRFRVDAGRLWAGGAATALVSGLIVLVGVLIVRGLLNVPVLSPTRAGMIGDGTTGAYAAAAIVVALLATALLYLLMLTTPHPERFFQWIMALVTVAAVALPFSVSAAWQPQLATAVINLVVGAAILTLLTEVAKASVRRRRPPRYPDQPRGSGVGPGGYGGPDERDTMEYPTYPERRRHDPPGDGRR